VHNGLASVSRDAEQNKYIKMKPFWFLGFISLADVLKCDNFQSQDKQVNFFLASYTAEHERTATHCKVRPTDLAGSSRGHCTLTRTSQTLGEIMAHQLQGVLGSKARIQLIAWYVALHGVADGNNRNNQLLARHSAHRWR
jgi:hypothetical protein